MRAKRGRPTIGGLAGGVLWSRTSARPSNVTAQRGFSRMTPPDLDRTNALFLDLDGTLLEIAETPESVVVRVTDDGLGIPDGEAARLFEPFYRVSRRR